ncbi:MAG TPA: MBG domain-containing protein, partial [Prolixibacteraceae bacterium]|nr:MBG domain-containing protein [Prolixibacteraceae bacterium]
ITVTASAAQTKVYDQTDPVFTYSSSDVLATFTGLAGRVAGENVGAYAINQGTLVADANWNIATFVSANFAITPKDITVTASAAQTKVYDQSDPVFTYTSNDALATFTGLLDREAGENVGEYEITQGTLVADANWNIATFNSADFSITSKDITVTASAAQAKVYGQTDPVFTYTSSDVLATFTGLAGREAGENVGDYAITKGTLVAGANWNIATFVSDNFAITPKDITVTANADQTKAYGDIDPVFTYTSSDATATFTGLAGRVVGENVGAYVINQGTLVAGANWHIATFNSADFSITPKEITVTANAAQTKVYDQSDPVFTYTSSDALATFTGLLNREAGDDVGNYAINKGTLVAGANWNIATFNSADFTITPKNITVTVDAGQSKVYGESDPTSFTYTSSDPSATFTGSLKRVAGEIAGSYAITQGTLTANSNMVINVFNSANFTIFIKEVTVTVDAGQSKAYGQSDPTSFSYTSSDPTATFTGSLKRVAGENVGNFTINQGTLAGGSNWNITAFNSADFSITPKDITVTVNAGQTKAYGQSDPTSFTYTSSDASATFTGSMHRETGENVGDYAINQGTLAVGENWNIVTFNSDDFSITPNDITITANDQSKMIGTSDPDLTYQITAGSLQFGDEISGSVSRELGESVGEYAIEQGTISAGDNYNLNFVPGVFSIAAEAVQQYTLTIEVVGSGSVNVNGAVYTTAITVDQNSVLNLAAIAAEGYEFVSWTGDVAEAFEATTNITMNGNKTITATFTDITITQYALTIEVVGNGSVNVNGAAYTTAIIVNENSVLNLAAIAAEGYEFVSWTGDVAEALEATTNITMNGNKTITATFTDITISQYALTIEVVGNGSVNVNGAVYTTAIIVDENTVLDLTAIAAEGYKFTSWTGDVAEALEATTNITMNGNKTITATFTDITITQYALTIKVVGSGSVNVNGAVYTTAITVDQNTVLDLTAIAAEGYKFTSWTGNVAEALEARTTFTMPANDVTLTASFGKKAPAVYTVSFSVTNKQQQAVEGATIAIDGFADNLVTNASGVATIKLEDGTYDYTVTTDGFKAISGIITVAGKDLVVNVNLITVGVETALLSNIELFPNPFSSFITLTNASRVSRVIITNLVGQTMMEIQFSGAEKETIATHDLVNGIYMIQIYGEKDEMIIRKMLNR